MQTSSMPPVQARSQVRCYAVENASRLAPDAARHLGNYLALLLAMNEQMKPHGHHRAGRSLVTLRAFVDLDNLNPQALEWTSTSSLERSWVEDRNR